MEIDAEALVKATKVDAVYDSDPKINANTRRFERLTYIDALNMPVGVMDSTAMAMCMNNDLPVYVINLWHEGSLHKVVTGRRSARLRLGGCGGLRGCVVPFAALFSCRRIRAIHRRNPGERTHVYHLRA